MSDAFTQEEVDQAVAATTDLVVEYFKREGKAASRTDPIVMMAVVFQIMLDRQNRKPGADGALREVGAAVIQSIEAAAQRAASRLENAALLNAHNNAEAIAAAGGPRSIPADPLDTVTATFKDRAGKAQTERQIRDELSIYRRERDEAREEVWVCMGLLEVINEKVRAGSWYVQAPVPPRRPEWEAREEAQRRAAECIEKGRAAARSARPTDDDVDVVAVLRKKLAEAEAKVKETAFEKEELRASHAWSESLGFDRVPRWAGMHRWWPWVLVATSAIFWLWAGRVTSHIGAERPAVVERR